MEDAIPMLKWDKYDTEFKDASKKVDEAHENYKEINYTTKAEVEN